MKSAKINGIKKSNLVEKKERKLLSSCIRCKSIIFQNTKNNIIEANYSNNCSNFSKQKTYLNLNINFTPISKNKHNKKILYEKKPLSTTHINNKNKKVDKEIQLSDFIEDNKQENYKPLKLAKTLYTKLYKKNRLKYQYPKLYIFNKKKKNIRLKNNELRNNLLTNYLKRKKIDNIPITFPLYLSFNKNYNSMSQKERVGKNIEKLICLKTHIVNNPNKKYTLIKEFMLTNGINKEKYLKLNNILKFENYLNQPINIHNIL